MQVTSFLRSSWREEASPKVFIWVVAHLSLSGSGKEVGWGGRLFEAGRLLTFPAFRMGAYSRWALIRGWALIRINTVYPLARSREHDRVNQSSGRISR